MTESFSMLARRAILSHPVAGEISLPLLVPAFSSKGSILKQPKGEDHDLAKEVAVELVEFGRFPQPAVLVSAYDLHFRHLDLPDAPPPIASLRNAGLVLLDSGGYEMISEFDSTEIKRFAYKPKDGYGCDEYAAQIERLQRDHPELPLVIANCDFAARGKPLNEQIAEARAFFGSSDSCLRSFILKPVTPNSDVVHPEAMSARDFANLRGFDVIGVAEKELGRNLLERLHRIAKLRHGLDQAGLPAPIHIWGGLDPVLTPLMFFAGASIFDGLSWLRYAYKHGMAINRTSQALLSRDLGVEASMDLNHHHASMTNLQFLTQLTASLEQWVDYEGLNFDMFDGMVREALQNAYYVMKSKFHPLLEAA